MDSSREGGLCFISINDFLLSNCESNKIAFLEAIENKNSTKYLNN